MKTIFINKTKKFKIRFRYNFVISDGFIMRVNSKTLLIIKRVINLIIDINENEKIAILSLSVLNNYSIINFKLNTFKAITTFNEIFFKIKMKLNKLSIFFSIIAYLF